MNKNDAQKNCDDLAPVGKNPVEHISVTKFWAGPDDCDFNCHLSNSSYSKVLDIACSNSVMSMFPSFALSGGMVALAGTHFQFLREIPMFARYEVHSQVVGWDHKWLYAVHRFVSHKLPSRRSAPAIFNSTYSDSPSFASTPSDSSTLPSIARAAAARDTEPDGATLHCQCISVDVVVFKHGRIPPRSFWRARVLVRLMRRVPLRVRAVELGQKGTHELYHGAWRVVPKGPERWWDAAIDRLEDRIEQRVARVIGVWACLEGALEVRGL